MPNPCRSEIVRCTEALHELTAGEAHAELVDLASLLQTTYQRDRKISNTLRGDILQCLGQLLEAAPLVRSGHCHGTTNRLKIWSEDFGGSLKNSRSVSCGTDVSDRQLHIYLAPV